MRALIALIGFVSAVIGIFVFVTGYDSLPDFWRNIGNNPALPSERPAIVNARINNVSMDRFRILSRRDETGEQPLYAIERAFLFRPRFLVELQCERQNACTGVRLASLGRLSNVHPLSARIADNRVVLLDHLGRGIFYNGDLRVYSKFTMTLPCAPIGYERVSFADQRLEIVAHARDCHGEANIGGFSATVARPRYRPLGVPLWSSMRVTFEFDDYGAVVDGAAALERARIVRDAPTWIVRGFAPRTAPPTPPPGPDSERLRTAIVDALTPHRSVRLHIGDDFTEAVRADALNACDVTSADLVGFVDGSLNGDGAIGTCFREDGVVSKGAGGQARFVPYASLRSRPARFTGGTLIIKGSGPDVAVPYAGVGQTLMGRLINDAASAAGRAERPEGVELASTAP